MAAAPVLPRQYPLDLVLLAALHPAVAQMLSLYWTDETVEPGDAYDYLILADQGGLSGWLRIPADGVDLRLVDPEGTLGHTRRFLPAGDYTRVDTRVLRKADGTGFFVVPEGFAEGERFEEGEYRLKLIYRRDNRAADPTSQILSEAGDSSPESVTIDVP